MLPAASTPRARNVCEPSGRMPSDVVELHGANAAVSRLHWRDAPASVWMVKEAAPLLGSGGKSVNDVSGGVVSTVHVNVAADASVLPARSVAATENVCWPSVRPVTLAGLEQSDATVSIVQRKLEPVSVEPNVSE